MSGHVPVWVGSGPRHDIVWRTVWRAAWRAEWRAEWISRRSHSRGDRKPVVCCGHNSPSGPGSRPSGLRFRCSAPGAGSGPVPAPAPEDPHLIPGQLRPDTRKCMPQPIIRFPFAAPFEPCLFLLPTCHRASMPPRGFAALTFAQELRSDLHLCTVSCPPVHESSGPRVLVRALCFAQRAYASFAARWNSRRISLPSEFFRSVRWMSRT